MLTTALPTLCCGSSFSTIPPNAPGFVVHPDPAWPRRQQPDAAGDRGRRCENGYPALVAATGLQQMVGRAVRCVQAADEQGVSRWLALLDTGDDRAVLTRDVAALLLQADGEMLQALRDRLGFCERPGVESYLEIDISDGNDQPVTIDDLDPALRCALRALLAAAYGDRESCHMQLELMFSASRPEMTKLVLAHILGWTADIVDSCEERGAPVPSWL